jgi:perosamine synthetase
LAKRLELTGSMIPIAKVDISGNEKSYLAEAIESEWISSTGKFVKLFEEKFETDIGVTYATAVTNGTVALHLALLSLEIVGGDEVIVPGLTYIATVNAVSYVGATPVIVDVYKDNWTIDITEIEKAITSRTKAIIVVHIYGQVANMSEIMKLASKYGLYVVEDVAEAPFSKFLDKHTGSIGHIGVFSFFGNKSLTTGEGGMVTTNSTELATKIKMLMNQGQPPGKRYFHSIIGYNYRMTNLCAAIGLGQLERWSEIQSKRKKIFETYQELLENVKGLDFPLENPKSISSPWMFTLLLPNGVSNDAVVQSMLELDIETRPTFTTIPNLPPYKSVKCQNDLGISNEISRRGISLPTFNKISEFEQQTVVNGLIQILNSTHRIL